MASMVPSSRSVSIYPPNPTGNLFSIPPPDLGGDSSDNENDFGDDGDHHHEGDDYFTRPDSITSDSLMPTATSSLTSSTLLPTIVTGTTLITTKSSSRLEASSTSSTTAPGRTAQSLGPGTIDSIPQNEADPVAESRITASPLGTAGIALVAIFGFVAFVTLFYFFFRMRRRREAFRNGALSTNMSTGTGFLEKGPSSSWPSTNQETGIVFGCRSAASQRLTPESRDRSRFSFLNRRWHSTGSGASPQAQHSRAPPPSPPRWGAALFGLGLGLRSQAATPRSQSVSMCLLEASYKLQATGGLDVTRSELQRNRSQSNGGDGHARAYAHHNVMAPRSVARSTMMSVSSRLIRRKDRDQTSPLPSSRKSPSEMSRVYDGLSTTTMSSEVLIRPGRENGFTAPPRIPLPVAITGRRRSSSRSV